MPRGVVIDTNVLEHASNPTEIRCNNSIELIDCFTNDISLFIYMDEGYDPEEAKNKSQIGGEYMERLDPGMYGYTLLLLLVKNDRIKFVEKKVSPSVSKIIRRIGKPVDRVFAKVAFNSSEKILISHDFTDFSNSLRVFLLKEINLKVIEAMHFTQSLIA
jgi:hypothetical protein